MNANFLKDMDEVVKRRKLKKAVNKIILRL